MRLTPVTQLEPGMRVARSLHDPYGHRLIACGYVLDDRMIAKIREPGFKAVCIDDGDDSIELHEVVREQTRASAVAALLATWRRSSR